MAPLSYACPVIMLLRLWFVYKSLSVTLDCDWKRCNCIQDHVAIASKLALKGIPKACSVNIQLILVFLFLFSCTYVKPHDLLDHLR